MENETVMEGTIVEPGQSLSTINREEIDIQVATAHRWPRIVSAVREEAKMMATLDEDTAASCFYALPRGGKNIEGPSIRLAEIFASCWGNLRAGARILSENDGNGFCVAQGFAHDLEKNVAITMESRRKVTGKDGKLFNADMMNVTANAAASIALRNALFRVIPRAYVDQVCAAAKKVAVGDATTLSARREKCIAFFAKVGVSKERVFEKIGRAGVEDITLKDLELLIGISTAIKEGSAKIDDVFPLEDLTPKSKTEVKKDTAKKNAVEESPAEKKTVENPEANIDFGKLAILSDALANSGMDPSNLRADLTKIYGYKSMSDVKNKDFESILKWLQKK